MNTINVSPTILRQFATALRHASQQPAAAPAVSAVLHRYCRTLAAPPLAYVLRELDVPQHVRNAVQTIPLAVRRGENRAAATYAAALADWLFSCTDPAFTIR